jgi:hypothetical protein
LFSLIIFIKKLAVTTGQPAAITLCPLNVCKNNGVCIVNSGSLSCVCQVGLTGVFCETLSLILIKLN